MLFNIKTKNIQTLKVQGIHLISVDTNWMGTPMRLGDLTMTSCMLLALKHQLIRQHKEFNRDNLFFQLNRVGGLKVNRLFQTLRLFPNVWHGVEVDAPRWYNVRNLMNGGNIWSFKCFLERQNLRLNDVAGDMHVVDPMEFDISTKGPRNMTYLFPVRHKEYNVERNMSDAVLIDILKGISGPVTLITKDVNDNLDNVIKSHKNIRTVNIAWIDIILSIITDGKLFISGDCGLTHLISMIRPEYKPAMDIYYKTNPFKIGKMHNDFDNDAGIHKNTSPINFKPYSPYLTDELNIKTF